MLTTSAYGLVARTLRNRLSSVPRRFVETLRSTNLTPEGGRAERGGRFLRGTSWETAQTRTEDEKLGACDDRREEAGDELIKKKNNTPIPNHLNCLNRSALITLIDGLTATGSTRLPEKERIDSSPAGTCLVLKDRPSVVLSGSFTKGAARHVSRWACLISQGQPQKGPVCFDMCLFGYLGICLFVYLDIWIFFFFFSFFSV